MRLFEIMAFSYEKDKEADAFIQTECKYWLEDSNGSIAYHGSQISYPYGITTIKTNQYRPPRDTDLLTHNYVNQALQELGFKINRSHVFCSGDINRAKVYGTPYRFYPSKYYRYLWSPKISDLNTNLFGGGEYSLNRRNYPTYSSMKLYLSYSEEAFKNPPLLPQDIIKEVPNVILVDKVYSKEVPNWKSQEIDTKQVQYHIVLDMASFEADKICNDIKNKYARYDRDGLYIQAWVVDSIIKDYEVIYNYIRGAEYTDDNLEQALISGNEIIVNCDEFYLRNAHD